MSDERGKPSAGDAERPDEPQTRSDYDRLRDLLVGPERRAVERLESRLDDDQRRAAELGPVVADAIEASKQHDERALADALSAPVARAVRRSVRVDPRPIADALFPIMGPAIRRAILEAVRGMIETTNRAIEASLSWQGIRWRFEAWRSGRPFAEIVLLHSLVYRVEQLLLIHKETGLLLRHVTADGVDAEDPDMVSGMLTAIRDFVSDSFGGSDDESVRAMQVGELEVLVQDGPHAVLAAVVRGHAPPDLTIALATSLEEVHGRFGEELAAFDGEELPAAEIDELLDPCMYEERRESQATGSGHTRIVWVAAALVLLVGLGWLVGRYLEGRRWERAAADVEAAPGIVVTRSGRGGAGWILRGLRDPLAADPADLVAAHGFDPDGVTFELEPYHSMDAEIVTSRIVGLLQPPAGLDLRFANGRVVGQGEAEAEWLEAARSRLAGMAPVTEIDFSRVTSTGAARRAELIDEVQGTALLMELDSIDLTPESMRQLDALAAAITELARLSGNDELVLLVTGHTDGSGSEARNLRLSQRRAERVAELLAARGVPPSLMVTGGVGSTEASGEAIRDAGRRRVSLRVEPGGGTGVR